MKKEIKVVFVTNGEKTEDMTECSKEGVVKAFTEYFENNYSEFESIAEDFIKKNNEK